MQSQQIVVWFDDELIPGMWHRCEYPSTLEATRAIRAHWKLGGACRGQLAEVLATGRQPLPPNPAPVFTALELELAR